jgi:hypothetical protein
MIQPIGLLAPDVQEVVQYAFDTGGFTTRSDYARAHVEAVAAAAVQGFLTTEVPGQGFGSHWRATALGIDGLFILANGRSSNLYVHGTLPGSLQCHEPAVLN